MNKIRSGMFLALAAAGIITVVVLSHEPDRDGTSAKAPASEAAATTSEESPEIGRPAPSFELTGMDGNTYRLSDFRGKPVVLNFWASWCGPCKDEAPGFAKLHDAHSNDLAIVAINLTAADREKSARAFAAKFGFHFPVPLDTDGAVAETYRIRPIPSTFFIDKDGIIVDGVLGALSPEDLALRADRLLHPAST